MHINNRKMEKMLDYGVAASVGAAIGTAITAIALLVVLKGGTHLGVPSALGLLMGGGVGGGALAGISGFVVRDILEANKLKQRITNSIKNVIKL